MEKIDVEVFKRAGFSFEEIQDIIESEQEFEKTWIVYDLDEAFVIIKNNLFASKEKECIK